MKINRRNLLGGGAAALTLKACNIRRNNVYRVGYLRIIAALPMFRAMEILNELGGEIILEPVEFRSSNEIVIASLRGDIDFASVVALNATFDAMGSVGFRGKLFSVNKYVKRNNNQSSDFLISNQNHQSIESLRGATIGFFPGTVSRALASIILPSYGLQLEDIEYVELAPAQWLPAMRSGAISAVTALDPFATIIMREMNVNILIDGYYARALPQVPLSGAWFVQNHLDNSTREHLVSIWRQAIQDLQNDRALVNRLLVQIFGLSPEIAQEVRLVDWAVLDSSSEREAVQEFASLLYRTGASSNPGAIESWIW